MKIFVALITALYLGIELQAWLFLTELYTKTLTPKVLGEYERFGYASFGIGVCILFIRIAAKNNSVKKFSLAILLVPLIYVASVWSLYEAVQRSASYIGDKPKALKSSVLTLSQPSWDNAFLYYFGTPQIDEGKVSRLMELYPPSEKLIQSSYIQGIRSIDDFSGVYNKAVGRLDKEVVNALIKRARLFSVDIQSDVREQESLNAIALQQAINERWLANLNPWFLSSYYRNLDLYPDSLMSAKTYYKEQLDNLDFHAPKLAFSYPSIGIAIDVVNWPVKKQSFTKDIEKVKDRALISKFLGYKQTVEAEPTIQGLNYFRFLVSSKLFEPLVLEDDAFPMLPWDSGASIYDDSAFLFGAMQIAPFFFKDGEPVVNFSMLSERETQLKYIDRIRVGLPQSLRSHWIEYQKQSFIELSRDSSAWSSPASFALNKDLVRVGGVLPLMLFLSTVMLAINLAFGLSTGWKNAAITVSAIIIAGLGAHLGFTEYLKQMLLLISVKEPQIFVF
ncbi:hypothetical protein BM525_21615 (plasmid) [Alteromonas mediterranea]|uniref:Uncharacterized protein n=1 Tax=Alteromonas mediterranea TaxID=314275 RepID=A0AAC9NT29_9ALTE|nr:hypothetical protein [Alteromonas mediterranea]APD92460.1 hypothetical protein BM524_21395 [Alteromonas mediterranea]APE00321.1 hypothetical protein BM525_21615 [Alteromonas mediterranea]